VFIRRDNWHQEQVEECVVLKERNLELNHDLVGDVKA